MRTTADDASKHVTSTRLSSGRPLSVVLTANASVAWDFYRPNNAYRQIAPKSLGTNFPSRNVVVGSQLTIRFRSGFVRDSPNGDSL